MELGKLTVKGTSVSGVSTCLIVMPYKVVLDIGTSSPEASRCRTVLITHAHIDHMAGAVSHAASRALAGESPSRFVCSPEVASHLERLLQLWKEIQGDFGYEVLRLAPGDDPLALGKGLSVRAVPTFHRIASQGYVLYETRRKLKPEYVGLQGAEIGALHQSGVTVMDQTEVPVLAFLGDTTPEALSHPEVQRAQTLITECTFVGGDVTDTYAREMGHTHLKELVPYLSGMAFKSLLLMHFSLRYSRKEVEATVTETLPEQVKQRTSVLFDDDSSVQKR